MVLNTGWKHWDIYLSKFVGKKINILEIGSYKGDATSWFLNNLSSNKNSMVYAVDTWEGSPEYFHGNFKEVEDIFDKTVELTGKTNQLIKMKMYSSKALIELNRNNIVFDIIFIDASHEAIDVLSDAVLSWNILNENGVLIFDDYKWDKLENYHFRPKVAIDAFIDIYKTQFKTLYIGYQVIIEKRIKDEFNKPVPGKYYNLMNRLNLYNIVNLFCVLEDKLKKLFFNLKFCTNIPLYKKTLGFNKNLFSLYTNKNKSNKEIVNKYFFYNLHTFVTTIINKNKILSKLNSNNTIKNKNIIKNVIYYLDSKNNSIIENICYAFNNKLLKLKNGSMTFLNIFNENHKNDSKLIKLFLECKFNLKKLNYYDLNLGSLKSNSNNTIFSKLKNINDIKDICDKLTNKIDFFIGSLINNVINKNIETKFQEQHYYIDFLNLIYFILNSQNKGGIAFLESFFLMTEVSIQLLWILKKFYKRIIVTVYDTSVINAYSNKIICEGFKGCTKKNINEIYNICIKIYENPNNINNKDNIFIENIIEIPNNEVKLYNEFKNEIAKYNIERYNLLKFNQTIINDLIYFNNKSDLGKSKRENMNDKIFTVQLRYLIEWINKYKILDNIDIR